MLPPELIAKYRNRIINIHPSLIPSFCGNGFYGLHVHEKALERGVKVTGATVHFVDEGTDTGPIIYQKAVEEMCIRDRVASGTFGSGAEYGEFVDLNRLGAVVTKGVANVPWEGNPTPRIAETYGGMLNAVGLQNPGYDLFAKRDIPYLQNYDTNIIVNVCGRTTEDYIDVVEKLGHESVDMLEINISCPNVKHGGIAVSYTHLKYEVVYNVDGLITIYKRTSN